MSTENFAEDISSMSATEKLDFFASKAGKTRVEMTSMILNMDPLVIAEEMTGKSYKEDEQTLQLGMGISMNLSALKKELLTGIGDSFHSNTLAHYLSVVSNLGFELAARIPFTAKFQGEADREEIQFIYAHPGKGIILNFDTYRGERVNGGNFYYCIREKEPRSKTFYRATSSGSFKSESLSFKEWAHDPDKRPSDLYWEGHHDCREALAHSIAGLSEVGTFIPKWPVQSHGRKFSGLYFTNYRDWERQEETTSNFQERSDFLNKLFLEKYNALKQFAKDIIGDPGI